jgi:hypothetical protein
LTKCAQHESENRWRRVLLRFSAEHGFVLGVGFDDRGVVAATMDLQLKIKSRVSEPALLEGGPEGQVNQLLSCARAVVRQAEVVSGYMEACGIYPAKADDPCSMTDKGEFAGIFEALANRIAPGAEY